MSEGHGHDHKSLLRQQNKSRLLVVLGITLTLMTAEVVVGIWSGSLALLADAGHMLSDVGGIVLALIAISFASRPASKEKTYGYMRSEILAGFVNSLVLVGISGFILFEAYQRFASPPEVNSLPVLLVALMGLGLNFISLRLLSSGQEKSLNMKAAYLEILADMLGLIAVVISSIIIMTTGWYLADPILSALIALMILPRTWMLLSECTHILMEGTPGHINLAELRASIMDINGVKEVHDLHVWTLTSDHHSMSAHVTISDNEDHQDLLARIRSLVEEKYDLHHSTIQLELANRRKDAEDSCSTDA